jgi:hypothetical protein
MMTLHDRRVVLSPDGLFQNRYYAKEKIMTAQEKYDSLDIQNKNELLKKIGETSEEARILGQRDYVALGGWVKSRLKRHWGRNIT